MGWTFFYMFVVLKIPILAAFLLIWYASKPPDDDQGEHALVRGEGDHGPRPHRPQHRRRGPHPSTPPVPPRRIRVRAPEAIPVSARHASVPQPRS